MSGGARKGAGRPAIGRDEKVAQQVQTMAGLGLSVIDIGLLIGMSQPTVHKYYMPELQTGHIVANVKVAQSLFRMATHPTHPNVAAAIYWTKTRMRWREDGDDMGKKETAEALAKAAGNDGKWAGLLT